MTGEAVVPYHSNLAFIKMVTAKIKSISLALLISRSKIFLDKYINKLTECPFLLYCRPDLFDFNTIAREQPETRLEHAFRVAHEHLGVDRILDPEGKPNSKWLCWNSVQ